MWYKLNRIMMWVNGVEKQVRPSGWQPWANTLLYLPLENDTLDHSWGTAYNPTWSITFTTLSSWKKVGYINWNNFLLNSDFPSLKMDMTVSFWINPTSQKWEYQPAFWQYKAFSNYNIWAFCRAGESSWTNFYFWTFSADTWNINLSWWNLITITYTSSWTVIVYKNWTQVATRNSPYNWWNWYQIWGRYDTGSSRTQLTAYMSEIFVENRVRTAQEVADYYNQTKANYWIS